MTLCYSNPLFTISNYFFAPLLIMAFYQHNNINIFTLINKIVTTSNLRHFWLSSQIYAELTINVLDAFLCMYISNVTKDICIVFFKILILYFMVTFFSSFLGANRLIIPVYWPSACRCSDGALVCDWARIYVHFVP